MQLAAIFGWHSSKRQFIIRQFTRVQSEKHRDEDLFVARDARVYTYFMGAGAANRPCRSPRSPSLRLVAAFGIFHLGVINMQMEARQIKIYAEFMVNECFDPHLHDCRFFYNLN